MDEINEFVSRALKLCETRSIKPSTLSRKLLGNGLRLGQLQQGCSLRVDTLARAKEQLEEMERAA